MTQGATQRGKKKEDKRKEIPRTVSRFGEMFVGTTGRWAVGGLVSEKKEKNPQNP